MSERSDIAFQLLSHEIANARKRHLTRLKKGSPYALAITNTLAEYTHHIRRLRIELRRLQRLEKREREYQEQLLQKTTHNANQRVSGTYGK